MLNKREIENWFKASAQKAMHKANQRIQGKIVEVTASHVVVDSGFKSESYVPIHQFSENPEELEVGNELGFIIILLDGGSGDVILSRDRSRLVDALHELEKMMNENKSVACKVVKQVRGGYTVTIGTIRAFLPNSLSGEHYKLDGDLEPVEMKILKVDYNRNNVIVSHQAAIYEQLSEDRNKLLESLQVDDIVHGTVKNITDFGLFIDLGGVDALVHISDISWKHVKHPSDIYSVGDKVQARVLKYQDKRISLGIKQVEGDPWQSIDSKVAMGDVVIGTVNHITEYGCFISIANGIEGLIHSSEMRWEGGKVDPFKILSAGEQVEVKVIGIDIDKKRIAFSMKECIENPWIEFAREHSEKQVLQGTVIAITDFGLFVTVAPKIDGLVHISDLSWKKDNNEILRQYKVGQEVEVMIIKIDSKSRRLGLSLKHLLEDHFSKFTADNKVGDKVSAVVEAMDEERVTVKLYDQKLTGYIPLDRLANPVSKGDEIEAAITSLCKHDKVITLSTKPIVKQSKRADTSDHKNAIASFGDLILNKIKSKKQSEHPEDKAK